MKRTFSVALVGMRFYSPPFDTGAAIYESRDTIQLHCEPNNPHDSNAIAILIRGHAVGHLDRDSAKAIAPLLLKGASYAVAVDSAVVKAATDKTIKFKVTITLGHVAKANVPRPASGRVAALYCITINNNLGIYIGQAIDVNKRIALHWKDLAFGCHANPQLQEAWNKYGRDALSVSVMEYAPSNLSPLELQRWLGDCERTAIEKARKTDNCLNIKDGEVVTTKAALSEYEGKRKLANKEHDASVRERKRQINAKIEAMEESRQAQFWPHLGQLRIKRNELSAAIRKNTGLRGFFVGSASVDQVRRWKIALEELVQQLTQLEAKHDAINEQIRVLLDERRKLKTVKQINSQVGLLFLRAGINRSGRRRIN